LKILAGFVFRSTLIIRTTHVTYASLTEWLYGKSLRSGPIRRTNRPQARDVGTSNVRYFIRQYRRSWNVVLGHCGLPHGCGQTALSRIRKRVRTVASGSSPARERRPVFTTRLPRLARRRSRGRPYDQAAHPIRGKRSSSTEPPSVRVVSVVPLNNYPVSDVLTRLSRERTPPTPGCQSFYQKSIYDSRLSGEVEKEILVPNPANRNGGEVI
jgi:hypothetical protein